MRSKDAHKQLARASLKRFLFSMRVRAIIDIFLAWFLGPYCKIRILVFFVCLFCFVFFVCFFSVDLWSRHFVLGGGF